MRYIAETAALAAALAAALPATSAQAAPAQNNRFFNNPSFGILPYTGNPAYYVDPKEFAGRNGPAKRDASPEFIAEPQVWTSEIRAWLREHNAKQSTSNQKREAFIDNMPKVIPDTRPIEVRLKEYQRLYRNLYPSEEKRDAFIDNMPKVMPHPDGIQGAIEEARRLYPEIYQRDAFIDHQPKVIPHPGGPFEQLAEFRRLYPELQERDAQGFGLEDFLGLPDTSVNPNFGNTGTFGKRLAEAFIDNRPNAIPRSLDPFEFPIFGATPDPGPKRDAKAVANAFIDNWPEVIPRSIPSFRLPVEGGILEPNSKRDAEAIANAFFDHQPKVVYGKSFKDIVYNNRSPFQLQQRAAEADPFLGDIMKLVGMVIDKTTKRDAVADPFLADIAKLGGMIIDKVTKRDAVADPFFADIVKLGGMIIDKTTKRDAAADPFLGDIMKLVGMVIDKTT